MLMRVTFDDQKLKPLLSQVGNMLNIMACYDITYYATTNSN